MGRFLSDLPDYGPVKLLNDIEHIMQHDPKGGMECKEENKCIHWKRCRRDDDNAHLYKDIYTKRKLFNCDDANDFVYIDMLDRLHSLLKHSDEIEHNPNRHIKLIKDDIKGTQVKFSNGVYMQYFSLKPLYLNLAEELTENQIYCIALHQFNTQLKAVHTFMKTDSDTLKWKAAKTDKREGIIKGDPIGVQHVLSIQFYTDYGKLCTSFRKSYWRDKNTETESVVILRHTNSYYWFGRFITNAIQFYGQPMKKTDVIYTGLNVKCLFDHFGAVFEMPTSTSHNFNSANKFRDGTGILLEMSPKYKHQMNISRYIDVNSLSSYKDENEYLFAGITMMAIINIHDTDSNSKWIEYKGWVRALLYLERIIEQTVHTKDLYNHSVITATQSKEHWMKKQRKYLVPLIKHQMCRNLKQYPVHKVNGIFMDFKSKNQNIPKYVLELCEHFCDNKERKFIDFSCINAERNTMDQSLQKILFKKNQKNQNTEYEINQNNITAIFPNVEQYKNQLGHWIEIKPLKRLFDDYDLEIMTNSNELEPIEYKIMHQEVEPKQLHNKIEQMDKELGIYYINLDRDDYFGADAVGKFAAFCEENGFLSDDIDEELNLEPDECLFVTMMDDDFPLNPVVNDEQKRKAMIFDVIKQIRDNLGNTIPQYHKNSVELSQQPTTAFFEVSNDEIEAARQLYETQCKSIWPKGLAGDKDLLKVLTIGHKCQSPYLQYLVDLCMREKIAYKSRYHKILTDEEWVNNNIYMQHVKKLNVQHHKMLIEAIKSFCSRVCRPIRMEPTHLIDDDLWKVSQYIAAFSMFMSNSAKTETIQCPCQIDVPIILKNIQSCNKAISQNESLEIHGDITQALETQTINTYSGIKFKIELADTRFNLVVRELTQHLTTFKHRHLASMNSIQKYPTSRRFCMVLDRREDANELHYFDPINYNEMTSDHVPEWYFASSKAFLLPVVNGQQQIITSNTACNIITLSFHIEERDNIKCYLYYMGGMMRFFLTDIVDVLPFLFHPDAKSSKPKKALAALTKVVNFPDEKFKEFLKSGATKAIDDEKKKDFEYHDKEFKQKDSIIKPKNISMRNDSVQRKDSRTYNYKQKHVKRNSKKHKRKTKIIDAELVAKDAYRTYVNVKGSQPIKPEHLVNWARHSDLKGVKYTAVRNIMSDLSWYE